MIPHKLSLLSLFSLTQAQRIREKVNQEYSLSVKENDNGETIVTGPGGMTRSINQILGDDAFAAIDQYGCWCYFENDHGRGKGAPVDSVDAMCKNLAMAYDCAMMDVAEETGVDDCVPWEVSYNAGLSFGIGALVPTCRDLNPGPDNLCAQYACMAEGAFVINVISAFLNIGTVNPMMQAKNGFDHSSSCQVNAGTQTDERKCCGVLPYRFPYKPIDKECCGASTYDPSMMDCCADNVPRFSCV